MSDVAIPPRSRPVGVLLVLFAVVAAGIYLAAPAGGSVADRGEAIVAASSLVSALVIRWAVHSGRARRGALWLALAIFMIALATGLHLMADLADRGVRGPRIADAFFL